MGAFFELKPWICTPTSADVPAMLLKPIMSPRNTAVPAEAKSQWRPSSSVNPYPKTGIKLCNDCHRFVDQFKRGGRITAVFIEAMPQKELAVEIYYSLSTSGAPIPTRSTPHPWAAAQNRLAASTCDNC
jgi:hypothetical protein